MKPRLARHRTSSSICFKNVTHFFHQLHISFSSPGMILCFLGTEAWKRTQVFIPGLSFNKNHLPAWRNSATRGIPLPKHWFTQLQWRESHWKSDRPTRGDERGAGRAILTSLAPSDPVSGFLLSGNGECGWKGSGVLPPPLSRFRSQTRPLCCHTSSHIPLNCARQQVETHSSLS